MTLLLQLVRERGQAHRPDSELIRGEFEVLDRMTFNQESPSESESLSGQEGGLAPTLLLYTSLRIQ